MRKAGRLCALLADCRSFRRGHGSARCRERQAAAAPECPADVHLIKTDGKWLVAYYRAGDLRDPETAR
jgi:hypothetical protein